VNWTTQCESIVVTEWWQPVPSRTLWGHLNQCVYIDNKNFESPENSKTELHFKNWMVIYNGVQENLSNSVSWEFISEVINLLKNQSQVQKINLIHRLKPGDQTPIKTFYSNRPKNNP
jgi:hypothetical protein